MSRCILGIEQPCEECRMCTAKEEQDRKITNADRIRGMTNMELAELLDNAENEGYNDSSIAKDSNGRCMDMLEWLESESGEK